MNPCKKRFENIVGKGKKCCKPAFSPLPTIFSTLLKTKADVIDGFILSPTNALNLNQFRIVSCSTGLKLEALGICWIVCQQSA